MNQILFFAAFLAVFILLNLYISRRFVAKLSISQKAKRYFHLFLSINLIGILFYMLSRYYVNVPSFAYFLFSLPIGILFLLFCTAIIYDITRVLLSFTKLSKQRRDFFQKTLDITSLSAAFFLMIRSVHEAKTIELQRVNIEIKNLKESYTIVQLSDIHIGGIIGSDFIKNIVERVNALQADAVVITGDLIDIGVLHAKESFKELSALKSKFGIFFVVGNHEYFHGIQSIMETLQTLGIKVLQNQNSYIGNSGKGFYLAGVYDLMGYRLKSYMPNLEQALIGTESEPTILLAHQPKFIEEVKSGVDLMLSGHTHGGQLYPFRFLVKLQQPYISGLHKHTDELQIYVNKGTGFWGPPMRLGASSEITHITLLPAINS